MNASMSGFDVIVCGSLHLDVMVAAPRLPRPDETVVGSNWRLKSGGKGGNQAVMAARAGARVAMIGRTGRDDFGARLRADLDAAGVDSTAVAVDARAASGMSVAIVRADGEYGAVIVSGAILNIDPKTVSNQWRALGGAKALVLQNEIPEAANLAAAEIARADAALIVLNAAPARALSPQLLERVDLFVVNRIEAAAYGGEEVGDRASAARVAARLTAGRRSVIVTLGGRGLVVAAKDGPSAFIPAKPVRVASAHGAGDCFVGTLAAALARGAALVDACRLASDAAADHVAGAG
ncbi:MAG TPA: PfkB family carbohydrate kinase [Roseiarcus sp.]|nr:PfkB family carbohydrate kinase [Roseiarcus sp.]